MNKSKKIEVNASSLLDLKAELFRKQEEYKRHRVQNPSKPTPKPSVKKPNVWTKQNSGVQERATRDFEERKEEEDALLKSRKALEAKTRIYEQMTQSLPADDDKSELYLVDFQRKVINSIKDQRMRDDENSQENSDIEKDGDESRNSNPDEDWVDYVDSLGRSRRCLRKDLDHLTRMDKSLTQRDSNWKEKQENETDRWNRGNDLLSEDMRKEIERKEWEAEEEEDIESADPVGPIHYQNVQQREIRNHGVGYYAFSMEENERKKQFEMLENLRKQTETNKSNRMKLKEKRKAMLQARLSKVQERKSIVLPPDENSSESDKEEEVKKDEEKESVPIVIPVEEETPKVVRPWDRGKIGVRNESFQKPPAKKMMTEGDWMNEQRNERNLAFAPPQSYFKSKKKFYSSPQQDDLNNIPLPEEERNKF